MAAAAAVTHDDLHVVVRPVPDHRGHQPAVARGEVHAPRALEVGAEALAHLADGGRVHDGRERLEVVDERPEEERLVAVLQRAQVHVLLDVVGVLLDRVPHLLRLRLQRQRARRHQTADPQPVALCVPEARTLVRDRVVHLRRTAHGGANSTEREAPVAGGRGARQAATLHRLTTPRPRRRVTCGTSNVKLRVSMLRSETEEAETRKAVVHRARGGKARYGVANAAAQHGIARRARFSAVS
jgi:hypothetical protein